MTKRSTGTLTRSNRMVECRACGKLTHSNLDGNNLDLCRPCTEYAGWENTHSDYNHDSKPHPACPICAAAKAAKETTMTTDSTTPTTTTEETTMTETTEGATVTPITQAKAPKAPKAKASKAAKPVGATLGVAFENGGEVVRLNVADIALNVVENLTRPEGLDTEAVATLAEKIATNGQETPVWVRRDGSGKYRVAAGFHRRAAIGLLVEQGRSDGTIEAKVLADASTLGASVANVTENENGKRDITPLGRVAGYSALIEQGLTVAQVAVLTGRAEDFVRDHLRLPKADPACTEALRASEDSADFIPWGVVRLVIRFPKGQQTDALKLVRGLSVAKAMAALKKLRDGATEEEPEQTEGEGGEGEGEGEAADKADPVEVFKALVGESFLPVFDTLMQSVRAADKACSTNDIEAVEALVASQRKVIQLAQDLLVGLIGEAAYNVAVQRVDARAAAADAADANDAE